MVASIERKRIPTPGAHPRAITAPADRERITGEVLDKD